VLVSASGRAPLPLCYLVEAVIPGGLALRVAQPSAEPRLDPRDPVVRCLPTIAVSRSAAVRPSRSGINSASRPAPCCASTRAVTPGAYRLVLCSTRQYDRRVSTRRLKRLVVAAVCLIFASPAPGTAGSQANDLSANLGFTALVSSPRGSATESLGFAIAAYIVWDATEPVTLELQVALPAGIRWAGVPPGSADGCISTATRAVCTRAVTPTPGTNLAAAFGEWAVVAERPGSYTFDAKVASKNGPDPDPSNDATSMTVTVAPSAGGVSLRPRTAAAGSTVTASLAIFVRSPDRTTPAAQARASCVARIGSKRVTAKAAFTGTRATCSVKTPSTARGKLLTGTLRTVSGPLILTKPFRLRLR
jgi:hypothetical protein